MKMNYKIEPGAKLIQADLSGIDLSGTDLSQANLIGADLRRSDLSGANLSEACLVEANLRKADLSGANLSGANLNEATLEEANLSGANLSGANLSETCLIGANLTGADLSGADLSGAHLDGANLVNTIGLGTKEGEIEFAIKLLALMAKVPGILEVGDWHSCLAGNAFPLEKFPGQKASLLLPTLAKYFFASNEEVIEALARVASGEESVFGV